LEEKDEE